MAKSHGLLFSSLILVLAGAPKSPSIHHEPPPPSPPTTAIIVSMNKLKRAQRVLLSGISVGDGDEEADSGKPHEIDIRYTRSYPLRSCTKRHPRRSRSATTAADHVLLMAVSACGKDARNPRAEAAEIVAAAVVKAVKAQRSEVRRISHCLRRKRVDYDATCIYLRI